MKTFKYCIYPSPRQERLLLAPLEECRWLWNYFLGHRKAAWEERQEAMRVFNQINELPSLKEGVRPPLKSVHSQVLQQVAKRLDLAMEAFFVASKRGRTLAIPAFAARDAMLVSPIPNGRTASPSIPLAHG